MRVLTPKAADRRPLTVRRLAGANNHRAAFTLVELLVVIGIVALLISILLPALNRARLQAKRTQDLSNIHQVALACAAYAAENHGDWPLGNRGGPNLNVTPQFNDDIGWINAYTFDYLLRFVSDSRTAQQWLSTTAPYPNGLQLDPSIQRRLACTSVAESPYTAQSLTFVGLANVGVTTWRYVTQQTDPAGAGYNETYMGFFYWGRRANAIQGPVYDQTGTLVPGVTFDYPKRQGRRSYTNTLLSCPAYTNISSGDYTEYTHCYNNDSFFQSANTKAPTPGDGRSDPSSVSRGICCAYTDGSARFVTRRSLWSVQIGGFAYVYFDKAN